MTAHSRLSASSSYIWLKCTKAGELFGTPDDIPGKDTVYTLEGTCAHSLAEECVSQAKDPGLFLNLEFDEWVVDDEMVDNIGVYVDHVNDLKAKSSWWMLETQVSLNNLWGKDRNPEDLFGTADFLCQIGDTLYVRDLKYGKGVVVEVFENPQLMYYGLGAYLHSLENPVAGVQRPIHVDMGIIQPRAHHADGPVRSWRVPVLDLLVWGEDSIKQTVEDIVAGRTRYAPDKKRCMWCGIAGRCPALRKHMADVAKTTFDDLTGLMDAPVDPETLSKADIAEVLKEALAIRRWLSQVEAAAAHTIETGGAVPGWKLVPKRGQRRWDKGIKQEALKAEISEISGLSLEDITDTTVKSVAQLEKVLKRRSEINVNDLQHLWSAESSGTKLVPEDDALPAAATGPQEVFNDVDL